MPGEKDFYFSVLNPKQLSLLKKLEFLKKGNGVNSTPLENGENGVNSIFLSRK